MRKRAVLLGLATVFLPAFVLSADDLCTPGVYLNVGENPVAPNKPLAENEFSSVLPKDTCMCVLDKNGKKITAYAKKGEEVVWTGTNEGKKVMDRVRSCGNPLCKGWGEKVTLSYDEPLKAKPEKSIPPAMPPAETKKSAIPPAIMADENLPPLGSVQRFATYDLQSRYQLESCSEMRAGLKIGGNASLGTGGGMLIAAGPDPISWTLLGIGLMARGVQLIMFPDDQGPPLCPYENEIATGVFVVGTVAGGVIGHELTSSGAADSIITSGGGGVADSGRLRPPN